MEKMSWNWKIVYLCDLGQDIDDLIACMYLKKKLGNQLDSIVLDRKPTTKEEKERLDFLEKKNIKVRYSIPLGTQVVFVGGKVTLLNEYLKDHTIEYIFMNGGFVGSNIPHKELKKFKGKKFVRTFNFNSDVEAIDNILKNGDRIGEFHLIGKNVCHNMRNTADSLWKNELDIIDECGCRHNKLQHDMLACHEGLVFLRDIGLIVCDIDYHYCRYYTLYPCTKDGLDGIYTQWGSQVEKNEYKRCWCAVDFI